MKLFVTGAGGFLGTDVVRQALARGHEIVALVRAEPVAGAATGPEPSVVVGDVRRPEAWEHALAGCDAVLHLAATFGEPVEQWDVVVHGTDQVLGAMDRHGVDRVVLVSSLSVYDYRALAPGDVLHEGSPLEAAPGGRDPYARAKLAQERLVADRPGLRSTVLRPGAIYGPGHLWNAGLALRLGGGPGLDVAPRGQVKLVYLESCSLAVVLAAEQATAVGATLNVVDDDLPTPSAFAAALRRAGLDAPGRVPVPYASVALLARVASALDRHVLRGRLRLPELAVPSRLAARYQPLRYANDEAKRVLGWAPPFTLDEALVRTAAAGG